LFVRVNTRSYNKNSNKTERILVGLARLVEKLSRKDILMGIARLP
jgi:hypothetical protein